MIDRLTQADRPRWTELWTAYLQFYDTVLPPEQYDHTWQRLMSGAGLYGFALRHEGRLAGITHYLFHESAWTMKPTVYLQDLFVDAAVRGQGGGRELIQAVGDAARAAGATRMYWQTRQDNSVARRLYDRLAQHMGSIVYVYPL